MGILPDALALRAIARAGRVPSTPIHRSAGLCLLVLALVLAVGLSISMLLPAVVAERHSERYALRPDVVYLKDARANDWEPSVRAENYRLWATSNQQFFSGLAFYSMEQSTWNGVSIPVAHGSANLFALLGLTLELGAAPGSAKPILVLSDRFWRSNFSANPAVLGATLPLGSRILPIAGVLPEGAWRLPGDPDIWLLESDAAFPTGVKGALMARANAEGLQQMWRDHVIIPAIGADGEAEDLCALSLSDRTRGPWGIYILAVLLAILALPAVTSVSLEQETQFASESAAQHRNLRRAFAAAKFLLILGIVYVVPLDIIHWATPGYLAGADVLQFLLTFGMGLFALWWSVADQRKRCPMCLRRVTHPAHVGIASRTFLAWNGTELFCAGGHTLLEVPDLPTSWFYSPRWVYLDSSWEFLFPI
jgi:hypothetical protein